MNPLVDLRNAAIGWIDLLGNRPDGGRRFNASRAGLVTMLGFHVLLVVVSRIVQTASRFGTFPRLEDLFVSVGLNAVPMLAVFLVVVLTVRFLKPAAGLLAMLVPAGYALLFVLAIGLPLSLVAGSISVALQGVLGYMLYRLGRDVGKFGVGVSVGFAVFSVVLLVAVPIGLYMLIVPDIPTPD